MIQNGDVLGGGMYRIIKEIGHGGTGIIYLAEHLRLQKKVIIKKIKENFVGQINTRAEVDILKKLHHTYLPQVYDFIARDAIVYTVMEYIEGNDLQWYIDNHYRFSEPTLVMWLRQLGEVLNYLHSQSPPILHSDIKPSNIMITPSGNICLIDFNISLDGDDSMDIQGVSAWYAAPEQFEKARLRWKRQPENIILDARMDIYSLGATFYTLMTDKLPNPEGKQFIPIIYMDIPYSDGLKALIYRMMQQDPTKRFRSTQQMLDVMKHMAKLDPTYKRYTRCQFMARIGYACCLIISILLIYYGSWKNMMENWNQDYSSFYTVNESQDNKAVISDGMELLNTFRYKNYLDRHLNKKAEILNAIGDSYFRQEDYSDAAVYYKEAMDIVPEEVQYCQNYVVALVRDHKSDQALAVLQQSNMYSQMEQESLNIIQAEIAIENGDIESAKSLLTAIVDTSTDQNHLQQCYLRLGELYAGQEDYVSQVQMLEAVADTSNSRDLWRQLGQAAMHAANGSSKTVEKNAYILKALDVYEKLNVKNNPTYEDQLNKALVERAAEQYASSTETLELMKSEYPDDYVIEMWICYNYLDIARNEKSYDSVMAEVKFAYQSCKHKYQSHSVSDENMEDLIQIMNQLEQDKALLDEKSKK